MSNIGEFLKFMEPLKKQFQTVCDVFGIDHGIDLMITKDGPILTVDAKAFPVNEGKLFPAFSISKSEKISDNQYKVLTREGDNFHNLPERLIVASTGKECKVLYINLVTTENKYSLILESEEEIKVGEIMIVKTENLAATLNI